MSENLKALDEFPTFTGEESPQEQIRQLQNYLYVVKEQLRYALSNLSEKNLNPTAWKAMQKQTLHSQSQEAVFNKLFDNGNVQGFDIADGLLYINGALAKIINLIATNIVTGILKSKDGETFYLDLDKGILRMQATEFSVKGKKLDEIVQEEVDAFSDAVTGQLANLQSQIDGNITTWFGDYIPSTSNKPASEWVSDEIKNQHLGDLFYIVDNAEQGGFVYRWAMVGGTYSWQIVEDVEVAKALEQAAKAQDTADGKRRVFVAQPTPPYDVGDLWTDGANLRVCQIARGTGAYLESDWALATNYIAKEDLSHEDIFKKLFDNGSVQGFEVEAGRLYINGEYGVIRNFTAEKLKSESESYIITIQDGKIVAVHKELPDEDVMQLTSMKETINMGEYNIDIISGVLQLLGVVKRPGGDTRYQSALTPQQLYFEGDGNELAIGIGNSKWEYVEAIGKTVLVNTTTEV